MNKRVIAGILTACLMFQSISISGFAASNGQDGINGEIQTVVEEIQSDVEETTSSVPEESTQETAAVTETDEVTETESTTDSRDEGMTLDEPEGGNSVKSVLPIEDTADANGSFSNLLIDFYRENIKFISGTFTDNTNSGNVKFQLYEYGEPDSEKEVQEPIYVRDISKNYYEETGSEYFFDERYGSYFNIPVLEDTKRVKLVAIIGPDSESPIIVESKEAVRDSFPEVSVVPDMDTMETGPSGISIDCAVLGIEGSSSSPSCIANVWTKEDRTDEVKLTYCGHYNSEEGLAKILIDELQPDTTYHVELGVESTQNLGDYGIGSAYIFYGVSEPFTFTTTADTVYNVAEEFPDEEFRKMVLSRAGLNGSATQVKQSELLKINSIYSYNESQTIYNIKGIDLLTGVTSVDLEDKQLTDISEIDWSKLKKLNLLNLRGNSLTTIPNLLGNKQLTTLNLNENCIPESEFEKISEKVNIDNLYSGRYWAANTMATQRSGNETALSVVTEEAYYGNEQSMPLFVQAKGFIYKDYILKATVEGKEYPLAYQEYGDVSGLFTVTTDIKPSQTPKSITFTLYTKDGTEVTSVQEQVSFQQNALLAENGVIYKSANSIVDNYLSVALCADSQDAIQEIALQKDGKALGKTSSVSSYNVYTDFRYTRISKEGIRVADSTYYRYYGSIEEINKLFLSGSYDLFVTYESGKTETLKDTVVFTDQPVLNSISASYEGDNLGNYLYLQVSGVNIAPDDYKYTFSVNGNILEADFVSYKYTYNGMILKFEKKNWPDGLKNIQVKITAESSESILYTGEVTTIRFSSDSMYYCEFNEVKNTLLMGFTSDIKDGEGQLIITPQNGKKAVINEKIYIQNGYSEPVLDISKITVDGGYNVLVRINGTSYTDYFYYSNSSVYERVNYWKAQGYYPQGTENTVFTYYSRDELVPEEYVAELLNSSNEVLSTAPAAVTAAKDSGEMHGYAMTLDLSQLAPQDEAYQVWMHRTDDEAQGVSYEFYIYEDRKFIITRDGSSYMNYQSADSFYTYLYVQNCLPKDTYTVTLTDMDGKEVNGLTCKPSLSTGNGYLSLDISGLNVRDADRNYYLTVKNNRLGEACHLDGKTSFYTGYGVKKTLSISTLSYTTQSNRVIGVKLGAMKLPAQMYVYKVLDQTLVKKLEINANNYDSKSGTYYYFTEDLIKGLPDKDGLYDIVVVDSNGTAGTISDKILGVKKTTTTPVPVTSVTLDKKTAALNEGETLQLNAEIKPANANSGTTLSWSTDDENVATVNANGLVTAIGIGKTVITVKTGNGKTASCSVTVSDIKVCRATIVENKLEISDVKEKAINLTTNGESVKRQRTVAVTGNINTPVFSTTDKTVATVSKVTAADPKAADAATVKAVGIGDTDLVISVDGITKSIPIHVGIDHSIRSVALNTEEITMYYEEGKEKEASRYVYATLNPADAQCPEDARQELSLVPYEEDPRTTGSIEIEKLTDNENGINGTAFKLTPDGSLGDVLLRYSIYVENPFLEEYKEVIIHLRKTISQNSRETLIESQSSAIKPVVMKAEDKNTLSDVKLLSPDILGGGSFQWAEPDTVLKADNNLPIQYFKADYVPTDNNVEGFSAMLPVSITRVNGLKLTPENKGNWYVGGSYTVMPELAYTGAALNENMFVLSSMENHEEGSEFSVSVNEPVLEYTVPANYVKENYEVSVSVHSTADDTDVYAQNTFSAKIMGDSVINTVKLSPLLENLPENAGAVKNIMYDAESAVSVSENTLTADSRNLYLKASYSYTSYNEETDAPQGEDFYKDLSKQFTIKSSDTSVARVVTKDGYTYLELKKAGISNITFTAKDKGKCSAGLWVTVKDNNPVLETDKVVINKFWKTPEAVIPMLLPWENRLETFTASTVSLVDKEGNPSSLAEDFEVRVEESDSEKLVVLNLKNESLDNYKKKTTVKTWLKIETIMGSYVTPKPISITVDVTKPTASLTCIQKANVFYMSGNEAADADYSITSKDQIAQVISNNENKEGFGFEYSAVQEEGAQGTVNILYRPKTALLTPDKYGEFLKKNGVRCADTLTVHFEEYTDEAAITIPVSVAVENKKLSLKTDALNLTVGQNEGEISVIDSRTKSVVSLQGAAVTVVSGLSENDVAPQTNGNLKITYNGAKNTTAKLNVTLAGTTQAVPLSVSIKRVKAPELQLSKKSVTLNSNLPIAKAGYNQVQVSIKGNEKLPETITYSADKAGAKLITENYLMVTYNKETGRISLGVNDEKGTVKAGKYNITINGTVMIGGKPAEAKGIRLSVIISEKTPGMKLKASGSINLIDRDGTGVIYTPALTETEGTIESVALGGANAENFNAELMADGKVKVSAKPGVTMKSKTKYYFDVKATLTSGVELTAKNIAVTPVSKLPKLAASLKQNTLYRSTRAQTAKIELNAALKELLDTEDSRFAIKTAKGSDNFILAETLEGYVIKLNPKTYRQIKPGTYTIELVCPIRDAAVNEKLPTVKVKVKVK